MLGWDHSIDPFEFLTRVASVQERVDRPLKANIGRINMLLGKTKVKAWMLRISPLGRAVTPAVKPFITKKEIAEWKLAKDLDDIENFRCRMDDL